MTIIPITSKFGYSRWDFTSEEFVLLFISPIKSRYKPLIRKVSWKFKIWPRCIPMHILSYLVRIVFHIEKCLRDQFFFRCFCIVCFSMSIIGNVIQHLYEIWHREAACSLQKNHYYFPNSFFIVKTPLTIMVQLKMTRCKIDIGAFILDFSLKYYEKMMVNIPPISTKTTFHQYPLKRTISHFNWAHCTQTSHDMSRPWFVTGTTMC